MIEILIVILLIVLVLAPFVLIGIGIYRCHNSSDGVEFFMFGAGWLSLYTAALLSGFVSRFIRRLLSDIPLEHFVVCLLWILFIFLSFRLFKRIEEGRKSKKYIEYAKIFISTLQNPSLPSCEQILLFELKNLINRTPHHELSVNVIKTVEIKIYDISFSFIGSSEYRDSFGELNLRGQQLLSICTACLKLFVNRGYLSPDEYDSETATLKERSAGFYSSSF